MLHPPHHTLSETLVGETQKLKFTLGTRDGLNQWNPLGEFFNSSLGHRFFHPFFLSENSAVDSFFQKFLDITSVGL